MLARIQPGGTLRGTARVPGDKSIAHRWLILAATARGSSRMVDLPPSLDVRSTASSLARVTLKARPALDIWTANAAAGVEPPGSTWNAGLETSSYRVLELEGEGRAGLRGSVEPLDCGNSGTSMRLLTGLLAAAPFASTLIGDASLSLRPMERVAEPLRRMGADIRTEDGHAPIAIRGGGLVGRRHELALATAQVKGAILLAGLDADAETTVVEPAATRDHTERALEALGAPIRIDGRAITVSRFQQEGFEATCPGDPSSAAFLVAAAALTGSTLRVEGVGLNPTRLRFLDVMGRMGVATRIAVDHEELGEPVGTIEVQETVDLRAVRIEADELPLVIDEVPVLSALAAHAGADSWFRGAGELRVKETDRLSALVDSLGALGGHAAVEGDDLVLAGGGLRGGLARSFGDHRLAMALAVAGLAAEGPTEVEGIESAEVSFPGFVETLRRIGASIEVGP
ncbi:MAG TPA: 3-phosphoshikimate 1-carboxyvinyltransferase [Actinomycetota bacterium]|nr:3-phosphoshikimate 1-carboxyvinyltransferase [Actinomycetota bacterium]